MERFDNANSQLIQEGFPHRDYRGNKEAEEMLDMFKKAFAKKED